MTATSLGHLPGDKWAFDDSVTQVFDDMLTRSIPQYAVMRDLVRDVAVNYRQPGTAIVDLGCSRGEALSQLLLRFGPANKYIGVDVSEPMLTAARQRFAEWDSSVVDIRNLDLRTDYPKCGASVTLAVLTLMFIPINHRNRIVQDIYNNTIHGGAVILVEKLLGSCADMDRLMVDRYHRMKAEHGYSQEEIDRKALALEGVQVPVTAAWNEDLLRNAGFRHVECFWRWMNFGAWVAVR